MEPAGDGISGRGVTPATLLNPASELPSGFPRFTAAAREANSPELLDARRWRWLLAWGPQIVPILGTSSWITWTSTFNAPP